MSAVIRCPHCKAELPEQASFCARCGRRIEGWSVPKDATPAMGESSLPGGEEATRQMDPTPSLLRAAAISVKKGGGQPRKRSKLPLIISMVVVAFAGGLGGFLIVRARMKKQQPLAVSHQPSAPIAVAPPIAMNPAPPTPNPQPPTPNAPAKTTVRKSKTGKRAHVIGAVPVPVKARASSSGGLPHKQVATDSKPMQMPVAQRETASEPAAKPPSEAEQKQEGEASVDADSVRFVVRSHLPQVRACYGRAFKDSSPGGTVEIGFAIDPAGHAKNVRTETNTSDSEGLAHCLEARVREWQFPKPVGGDYELIYPFVFAPGS